MRSRNILIGFLVLGLLALCACAVLGGALLGYQVLRPEAPRLCLQRLRQFSFRRLL